jgi:hypothetical protein
MVEVIVAEAEELIETWEFTWQNMISKLNFSPESKKILVVLNLLSIKPYPYSVNPDLLCLLLKKLKKCHPELIYVAPALYSGFNDQEVLYFEGILDLVNDNGAIPVSIQKLYFIDESEHTTQYFHLNEMDEIILLNQVGWDPNWKLMGGIPLLYFLNQQRNLFSSKSTDKNFDIMNEWMRGISNIAKKSSSFIVINDCRTIPILTETSTQIEWHFEKTGKIFTSTDVFSCDWTLFQDLGMNVETHPYFMNANSPKFNESQISIIHQNPNSSSSTDLSKKMMMKFSIPSIRNIHFQLGKLNKAEEYSLFYLTDVLKGLLLKDFLYLKEWHIVCGENPPEFKPNPKAKILLLGNAAIQSTMEYEFRFQLADDLKEKYDILGFKIGPKKILEGDELERHIILEQSKIRRKMEQVQNKIQTSIDFLKNGDQTAYHEHKLLEYQRNMDKKHAHFQYKIEKKRIMLEAQYHKLAIKKMTPKYVLNANILEIPGINPFFLEILFKIHSIGTKRYFSALDLYLESIKNYYKSPANDSQFIKERKKMLQKLLEKKYTHFYSPLEEEMEHTLVTINETKKDKLHEIQLKKKQTLAEIKDIFKNKSKELKHQKRSEKDGN